MDQAAATRPFSLLSFFRDIWGFFGDLFFGASKAEKELVSKLNSLTQSVREFHAVLETEGVTEDELKGFENALNTRLATLEHKVTSCENRFNALANTVEANIGRGYSAAEGA